MTSSPIRVLHFADIHIGMENFGRIDPTTGINQRVLDFVRRMAEVVTYALENDADCVIFAGDAFKTRDPNPTYQREFARQLMRLSKKDIPIVLLVGNHDTPIMEKRATSIDIFGVLDVPHVIVASTEELHRIETKRGTLQIGTVPWPQRSRLMQSDDALGLNIDELDAKLEIKVVEKINEMEAALDGVSPAILTAHLTVSGAVWGSERQVMIGRDTTVKLAAFTSGAWDYVALGHIHKHQNVNAGNYPGVVYSGSLERIDFGEEREAKGFCWIEASRGGTTWSFQTLDVRPFLTIYCDVTEEGESPTDAVLRELERHDVANAIVRVRVKIRQSQEPYLRTRDIEDALADAHTIAGIIKEIQRETRSRIGLENPESLAPAELLERYLLSKDKPADEIAALMSMANEILKTPASQ
jgi:DNA repair protein SbcD/Mre11